MSEKKCPHCNSAIPEESPYCMHCGKYVTGLRTTKSQPTDTKSKKKKTAAALLIALAAIILISSSTIIFASQHKTKPHPTTTAKIVTTKKTSTATTLKPTTKKKEKVTTTESTTVPTTTTTTTEPTTTTTTTAPTTKATTAKPTKKKTTTEVLTPTISGSVLKKYPTDKKDSTYEIPYKVKKISRGAFDNKYITTLKFSSREDVECDYNELFRSMPNLKTIYIYAGTTADLDGKQYFHGKIIYR